MNEPDPDCPAEVPMEGAACEGMQGTQCVFGEVRCRCRNSEPIWTCQMPGSDAGSGGRGGRGSEGGSGGGGAGGGGPGRGNGRGPGGRG